MCEQRGSRCQLLSKAPRGLTTGETKQNKKTTHARYRKLSAAVGHLLPEKSPEKKPHVRWPRMSSPESIVQNHCRLPSWTLCVASMNEARRDVATA